MSGVELRAVPYDFGAHGHGVKLIAEPGDLPIVYVDDGGEVEFGSELRTSRAVAAEWFRAVADYLNAAQEPTA